MTESTALLEVKDLKGTLVLTILTDQLRDFDVVQKVKEAMLVSVKAANPSAVVLDLKHVHLLGSIAFLAFLAIRRQGHVERVVLCEMTGLVQELFTICRLIPSEGHPTAPFETAKTVDAALAQLGCKPE